MSARQAVLCTMFIVFSQVMTMVLFLGCRLVFHADPFGIYANFVISFGGIIFGVLGCAGAYPAARLSGIAPSKTLLALMIGTTWGAVVLYQGLPYVLAVISGRPTAAGSFLGYLDGTMAHTAFRATRNSDVEDIGRYGYLFLLLDLAWSTLGAFIWHGLLNRIPHCGDCTTYFRKLAGNRLMFDDLRDANAHLDQLPDTAPARAQFLMQMHLPKVRESAGTIRFDLARHECPSCRVQSMTEAVLVHNGKGFRPESRQTYYWSTVAAPGRTRAAAAPESPAQPTARPQFGRKAV